MILLRNQNKSKFNDSSVVGISSTLRFTTK